jgi:hypothetical protein
MGFLTRASLQAEIRMKHALLLFAVLLFAVSQSLFTPPAFGWVPELNVTAVCKARSADAQMSQSPLDQSTAECVRDEEAAKQQLGTLWTSTSVPTRNQCESDARSLGTTSYLDLLACIQMAEDLQSGPKKETGKQ